MLSTLASAHPLFSADHALRPSRDPLHADDSLRRHGTLTPTAHSPNAIIRINGIEVESRSESFPIDVPAAHAPTPIDVQITASNQAAAGPPVTKHYALLLGDHPIDYLKASNTRTKAIFGRAIALSGDTLAVGASGDSSAATGVNGDQADTSRSDAGAVYVFVRTGSVWSQQAYIKASNTRNWARFGASVALSADTLIVGAPGEPSDASVADAGGAAGAAYVYR